MKLRNKILAFAAPTAAIATVMPITLTSCSTTIKMDAAYEGDFTKWKGSLYSLPSTHDVDSKTTFIINGIKPKYSGSNRVMIMATPKNEEKLLKTKSASANGKSLKVHEITSSGEKVWVCDSTEAFTIDTDIKLEFTLAESGKDCTILIVVGVAQ